MAKVSMRCWSGCILRLGGLSVFLLYQQQHSARHSIKQPFNQVIEELERTRHNYLKSDSSESRHPSSQSHQAIPTSTTNHTYHENGHSFPFRINIRNSSSNTPLPRSRKIRTAYPPLHNPLHLSLLTHPQTSTLRSLFAEAHPFARKTAYLKPHSVAWKFYRTKLGRASLMYFPGMTLVLGWPWAAKWLIMKGNGL